MRAAYNQLSHFYDLLSDRAEASVRRAALKGLNPGPGNWALEIGPGSGHSLADLAKSVGREGWVVGVDLSEGMLLRARSRVRAEGHHRVRLVQGDGASLPFRDSAFDAVLMCFTLELFDTPEIPTVLGECERVLKVGGRLAVAALSKTAGESVPLKLYEWSHRLFPRFANCRPIRPQEVIEKAGFRVDERQLLHAGLPVELVVAVRV